MANLAREGSQNPGVQRLANELSISKGYFEQSLRSLFRYREEDEEIIRSPAFMVDDLENLGYLEGDCDDITVLVAALTKSMGYAARLTALQTTSSDEYDHVFSEVRIGDYWLPIDITVTPGTEYSSFGYMSELV